MTPREQAAFAAGIETARQMALTAAVSIEVRDDAGAVRQQAAAAALQGLAEGLRILASGGVDPMQSAFAAIAADPAHRGTVECPTCKGRLSWRRDSHNGHLHGQCETDGCRRWMQ
ncbi:hypothetical protein [Methylobacterium radiotolerans]|uniref:hypothetical protein n=1 Tax=Methylobacterium radiotolerans TaxID=31998 RepID=UPI001F1ACEF0|nr:hypothetical protein [Methylobacterium radiotolerans]UIY45587.1 hypothetical protein LZ599_31300 [Methylobacterium radiotolerans]